jgi:hypothetical protein
MIVLRGCALRQNFEQDVRPDEKEEEEGFSGWGCFSRIVVEEEQDQKEKGGFFKACRRSLGLVAVISARVGSPASRGSGVANLATHDQTVVQFRRGAPSRLCYV